MLEKEGKVTTWAALVEALEETYGPSIFDSLEFALFKLFQEDLVGNYYANFTDLANSVERLTPAAMVACFISGWRREIQRDIIPLKHKSLSKAASLATLFEEKYLLISKPKKVACNSDISSITTAAKIGNSVNKAIMGPNNCSNTQIVLASNYNTTQTTKEN